jgi:hypothetical protein
VCPACKTKVGIKCMGSIGGKTPTEPNLFIYSSLTLDTLNKIKLMLHTLFTYNLSGKIRRLSMYAFKGIWPKGLNCLTHERIIHKVLIFT